MRVTDARYARERSQLELALQMIAFEARTHTIRGCTGLSDDRIRKLYATYFKTRNGATVRRQRGKSPRRVDVFFRSPSAQMEATTLALLMVHHGLFGMTVDGRLRPALGPRTVPYGRRLCRAYGLFRTLCPATSLSFEQAWCMGEALARGDEMTLLRCDHCRGSYVHDLLSATAHVCPCCRLRARSTRPG